MISAGITYFYLNQINKNIVRIKNQSLPYTITAQSMVQDTIMIWQILTDVGITQKEEKIKEAEAYGKKFKKELLQLKYFYENEGNDIGVINLDKILTSFHIFFQKGLQMIQDYNEGGVLHGNKTMIEFDSSAAEIMEKMGKFSKDLEEDVVEATNNIAGLITKIMLTIMSVGLISTLVSVLLAFIISRFIKKGMRIIDEASHHIAIGSQQVSVTSQQLSQGASTQAAATEQMSSTITELSTQTIQAAANTEKVKNLSQVTSEKAKSGRLSM
jgi:methyl-accepting chemotaxis protein